MTDLTADQIKLAKTLYNLKRNNGVKLRESSSYAEIKLSLIDLGFEDEYHILCSLNHEEYKKVLDYIEKGLEVKASVMEQILSTAKSIDYEFETQRRVYNSHKYDEYVSLLNALKVKGISAPVALQIVNFLDELSLDNINDARLLARLITRA